MPRSKSLSTLKKEREERIAAATELLQHAGKGIMQAQIELKQAPWKVTWERLDIMLEHQERIIQLLEELLKIEKAESKKKSK